MSKKVAMVVGAAVAWARLRRASWRKTAFRWRCCPRPARARRWGVSWGALA
jgi:hypothetical protein